MKSDEERLIDLATRRDQILQAEMTWAVNVVARKVVWAACDVTHHDNKDINDRDWSVVEAEIQRLTQPPPPSEFDAAYGLLTRRAAR